MGPFDWLAGRWTPEFEYRDRLADEVEDIAYVSTRTGTRRGFLIGVLLGAILATIVVGALRTNGLQTRSSPTADQREVHQQVTTPQPSAEELSLLKQENEQLKKELARAKAAEVFPPREKRAVEPQPPQPKAEAPMARPSEAAAREVAVKPEKKANPPAKAEAPMARPSKAAARGVAVKPEKKANPPGSTAAQPILSNCRKEGDCDPVGP